MSAEQIVMLVVCGVWFAMPFAFAVYCEADYRIRRHRQEKHIYNITLSTFGVCVFLFWLPGAFALFYALAVGAL